MFSSNFWHPCGSTCWKHCRETLLHNLPHVKGLKASTVVDDPYKSPIPSTGSSISQLSPAPVSNILKNPCVTCRHNAGVYSITALLRRGSSCLVRLQGRMAARRRGSLASNCRMNSSPEPVGSRTGISHSSVHGRQCLSQGYPLSTGWCCWQHWHVLHPGCSPTTDVTLALPATWGKTVF